MNFNKRNEELKKNGIDTGKYFSIKLPEGLDPGSVISIHIDQNGNPVLNNEYFENIRDAILDDGYVKNTKLHRRFVMAQMFRMLNHEDYWDHKKIGYTEYLKRYYSYNYMFFMMKDEINVLAHLEEKDIDSFRERSIYFTPERIVNIMRSYSCDLKEYIDQMKSKTCKGIPYKTIKGHDIFVSDIQKKIFAPIDYTIKEIDRATCYDRIKRYYDLFMKNQFIKMPYDAKKIPEWIDAFKGEGSFYTLKNLIMYHNCFLYDGNNNKVYGMNAMKILNNLAFSYRNDGWRLFAFMKHAIEINNFDFSERMKEVYSERC